MRYPVNAPITVRHGQWLHTQFYTGSHKGYDFGCPMNTPIASTSPGKVTFVGWQNGYGNVVYVTFGSLQVIYAHLNGFATRLGQDVTEGQIIGYSGNTGWSTGPHLHWEARVNGVAVDPIAYQIPVGSFWVRVDKPQAAVRTQPRVSAPLGGSQVLKMADRFEAVGLVDGDWVMGNNKWYKSKRGNFIWSGGLTRI